jgi:hypothetical protein
LTILRDGAYSVVGVVSQPPSLKLTVFTSLLSTSFFPAWPLTEKGKVSYGYQFPSACRHRPPAHAGGVPPSRPLAAPPVRGSPSGCPQGPRGLRKLWGPSGSRTLWTRGGGLGAVGRLVLLLLQPGVYRAGSGHRGRPEPHHPPLCARECATDRPGSSPTLALARQHGRRARSPW